MDHAPKTGISNTAASRGAITATAAAALLSVGRTTVFALARAGYIRRVHLPGMRRPRLLRADVEQLVADGFSGVRLGGGDTVEPHLLRTVRTVRTGCEGVSAVRGSTVSPLPACSCAQSSRPRRHRPGAASVRSSPDFPPRKPAP